MFVSASSQICHEFVPTIELAAPNSPRNPLRLFVLSHCVKPEMRVTPMLALTMFVVLPDESLSRY